MELDLRIRKKPSLSKNGKEKVMATTFAGSMFSRQEQ
jgi:hypothetical protein